MDSEEKKIDNKINENRIKLKEVNDSIENENNKMKKLDEIEELFVSLNTNINKCVDLLAKSIKGEKIDKKLSVIEENNKINFNKSMYSIAADREDVKKRLIALNEKKEEYQELIRKDNQILMKKESAIDMDKKTDDGKKIDNRINDVK